MTFGRATIRQCTKEKRRRKSPASLFFGNSQNIPRRTAPRKIKAAQTARALKLRAVSKAASRAVSRDSSLTGENGAARDRDDTSRNLKVREPEKAFANKACPFAVQRKKKDYLCTGNIVAQRRVKFLRHLNRL